MYCGVVIEREKERDWGERVR